MIISDVARDDEGPGSDMKGVELAQEVYAGWKQPVLLVTDGFDPTTLPRTSISERLALIRKLRHSVSANDVRAT